MNTKLVLTGLVLALLSGCATQPANLNAASKPLQGEAQEALTLAHLLRDNGRYKASYEVYQKMDDKHELSDAYLLEYASVAALVVPAETAIHLYQRAQQALGKNIQPQQSEAIELGLGRAYLQLAQREEAQRHFELVLSHNPNNATALNGLSVIANYQGRTPDALAYLQRAMKVDANNPMVLNNLAMTYLVSGDIHRTIELLQARQNTLPLSGKLNLALAYILGERTDKARQVLSSELPTAQTERAIAQFEQLRQRVEQGTPLSIEIAALSQTPVNLAEEH